MANNVADWQRIKARIIGGDVWALMEWLSGFSTSVRAKNEFIREFNTTQLEFEVFPQGNTAYDMLREAKLLVGADGENSSQILLVKCRDGTELALVSRITWKLYTDAVKAKDIQLREMGSVGFLQAILRGE